MCTVHYNCNIQKKEIIYIIIQHSLKYSVLVAEKNAYILYRHLKQFEIFR